MKHTIIVSGVYEMFLSFKKELYLNKLQYNEPSMYLSIIPDIEIVKECFKIYNANRQRKKNNWNEICKWCFSIENFKPYQNYTLIFGTLNFSDKTLSNTSERTRARYITKYLSDHTIHYIANIDYGKKKGREHYHFIAMTNGKISSKEWHKFGGAKFQIVPLKNKDIKSTKNYLLKLNNHSYKESTKQKRIIRDRHEDYYIDYFIDNIAADKFHRYKLKLSAYD